MLIMTFFSVGDQEVMRKTKSAQERFRESIPALLRWYEYNARVLPWREDPDPYHVWISEIMLQQTRVEAVRGYYERFLSEFPTIRAVAEAPEDRLVKMWEGLGYYSRVRNIAGAAKILCERYDGALPADYELLRGLPGIGEYTAGAIASMSFGICVPAVDGNVLRVYARLTAYRDDIRAESFRRYVRENLAAAMSEADEATDERSAPGTSLPGRVNQAIMDIGATVCIPNGKPHCDVCPLAHLCAAYAEDLTGEIPRKAEKKARPVERKTVLVIRREGRVLLHRRPGKGLLAGLWEFPNVPDWRTSEGAKRSAAEVLAAACREDFPKDGRTAGSSANTPRMRAHRLEDCRHVFSHIEWEMRGYRIEVDEGSADGSDGTFPECAAGRDVPGAPGSEYVWATAEELSGVYGLPSAFQYYKA